MAAKRARTQHSTRRESAVRADSAFWVRRVADGALAGVLLCVCVCVWLWVTVTSAHRVMGSE